jgi:two-component system probable response regulator PhcQ
MTRLATAKVLYVDDENQSLKYFAKLYGDRFDIATAESADEAIKYLSQNWGSVGILLTDQRMPGKTGVQLMEFCRSRYPNIVRILLTAFSELDAAIKCVNDGGAFRYLTKPIDEPELMGALLRGFEFHQALVDRDRLLEEKLSVLHRLIVMDRIRGMATAVTALEGRVRNAWRALAAYVRQSPIRQQLQLQMAEIANLNMVSIAKREAHLMVQTVEGILADTIDTATGFETGLDYFGIVEQFIQREGQGFKEDDVYLEASVSALGIRETPPTCTDRGLVERLLSILVNRVADLQEHPLTVSLNLETQESHIQLGVRGSFGELTEGQFASLFSAAIPLHKWPIGLDMDLLSAFLIVHHLGGELTVQAQPPQGPGFLVRLPLDASSVSSNRTRDPAWFESIYELLEHWQTNLIEDF